MGLLRAAEVQQRLRARLHQDQPHLLEPGRLQGEGGRSTEADVRRAAPQAQRRVGRLQRRCRVEAAQPLDGQREQVGVDLGAHEGVARRVAAYLGVVAERATEARDGDLDRAGRPDGRVVAPELVDDAVVADVPAGGGREQGQQHALAPPAHGPLVVADADPQGPEHVDTDHPAFIGRAPSSRPEAYGPPLAAEVCQRGLEVPLVEEARQRRLETEVVTVSALTRHLCAT